MITPTTTARRIVPAALAALAALLLAAAPAGAHLARARHSISTEVFFLYGIGVNQHTGELYTASVGGALAAYSEAGLVNHQFSPPNVETPIAVAVDNSSGPSKEDLYVDTEAGVLKLLPSGKEASGFTTLLAKSIPAGDPGSEAFSARGVAVNPANGDVVVEDGENGEVDIFSESGTFVSQFKGGGPPPVFGAGLAVGDKGEIFTSGAAGVQEWSPADGYSTPTTIDPNGSSDVAVDNATGHVFADEETQISEYDAQGNLLLRFGAGTLETSGAVAVNEATNTVYATSLLGTIQVFGPVKDLADVTTGTPASGVTSTGATVSGTVNPVETTVTGCSFEFGPSPEYGQTVPCAPPPPLTGNVALPEAAGLAHLQPDSTYHYRIVAVNGEGASYGEDETFQTPPAPPSVDGQSVSGLTQTAAILNASINPNHEATTYSFEYGTTAAYGNMAPAPAASVGSGYGEVVVGLPLAGLEAGVTYHFRVVATNATGTTTGADQTFTTPPPALPLVSTGAASAVSAEAATISGSVNPQGVASTYEFDLGVDTGYGTRIFGEAGSGTGARSLSIALRELTPNTTYHYRLVAMNSFGISYGPDQTFTTPAIEGALISGPAGAPLIPSPPFPEEKIIAAAAATAQSATVAHTATRPPARATRRPAKRRPRHHSAARRADHRNDRGGAK